MNTPRAISCVTMPTGTIAHPSELFDRGGMAAHIRDETMRARSQKKALTEANGKKSNNNGQQAVATGSSPLALSLSWSDLASMTMTSCDFLTRSMKKSAVGTEYAMRMHPISSMTPIWQATEGEEIQSDH